MTQQTQQKTTMNQNSTVYFEKPVEFYIDTNNNSPSLKIIPIGGTTTVQKNMYVYESGENILVMDCGIGFPDMDTPGVDIIIPDFTYVLENRHKVRGVVITHGHEDHRSSLPFLLRQHKFDVYAVPFVKGLIEKALEEHTDLNDVKIKAFNPDLPLQIGLFRLNAFRVNHSIPDTMGFAIDTPQGRVFHCADFKFDPTPVMDKPFDQDKARFLANEKPAGVLALLSDCLGSTSEGHSESEIFIQEEFEKIFRKHPNQQVLITTVSSNISRIKQAIEASIKYDRKVVISGRSLRNTISVAKEFKYIDYPDSVFIDDRKAQSYPQEKLTYIITGCYGQPDAGLARAARGNHRTLTLMDKSVIVFSADPIPNSLMLVNTLIDELYLKNATVYYSQIQDNLHVSGHGSKEDLLQLADIVKPKYYIPIGGNIKHMRAYSELIQSTGVQENRIYQLLDGQTLILENNQARLGKKIPLKEVYVDGNIVGDIGSTVIQDRLRMASEGMVVVAISQNKVEIITRGFIYVKESQDLINKAKSIVKKRTGSKMQGKSHKELSKKIERDLQKFFFKETGREPIVLITIL